MSRECRKFEKPFLNREEDSWEPDQSEIAARHLEECPRCRGWFEDLPRIWKSLDTWKKEPAPAELKPALLQKVRDIDAEDRVRNRFSRSGWRFLKPAASALLLLVGAFLGYLLGHDPTENLPAAAADRLGEFSVAESYVATYLEDFHDVPQRSLFDLYLNSQVLPEDKNQ